MTTKDEELKERIGELADIATNNYALYAEAEARIADLEETLLHHVAPEDALDRIKALEDALREIETNLSDWDTAHLSKRVINTEDMLLGTLLTARRVLEGK